MKRFTDVHKSKEATRMRAVSERITRHMQYECDSLEEMFVVCCLIASTVIHEPDMHITDGMDRALKVLMGPLEHVTSEDVPNAKDQH